MAFKSLLIAALFFMGVATRGAQAQLPGLISGIVPCSTGSTINAATSPVFPNAGVQLVCGGTVITGTTANSKGEFTISLGITTALLFSLLNSNCDLVVNTPLAACNATLPSVGMLTAPLQLLQGGGLIGAIINGILNLSPLPFSFLPKLG